MQIKFCEKFDMHIYIALDILEVEFLYRSKHANILFNNRQRIKLLIRN